MGTAGDSIREYFNSYATSLDELAWFVLLFLFEAETYWLDAEAITNLKRKLFVALRFACYAFLAHTVYAYVFNYYELTQAPILASVSSTEYDHAKVLSTVSNSLLISIDEVR